MQRHGTIRIGLNTKREVLASLPIARHGNVQQSPAQQQAELVGTRLHQRLYDLTIHQTELTRRAGFNQGQTKAAFGKYRIDTADQQRAIRTRYQG